MKIQNMAEIWNNIVDFISCVSSKDTDRLKRDFGVTPEIFLEIQEVLIEFLDDDAAISAPPLSEAFESVNSSRPNIDAYEMNDEKRVGVECVLWANDAPTEVILHLEMEEANNHYKTHYKYIGS